MAQLSGIGIGRRIAVGPVRSMAPALSAPAETPRTREAADELAAVDAAVDAVAADLAARGAALGGETAAVLDAQGLMAKDPALRELVAARVEAGATGYNVGYITDGEYLKYTVNVATAGTYTATFNVGSWEAGRTITVSDDDGDAVGTVNVPNTGSSSAFAPRTCRGFSGSERIRSLPISLCVATRSTISLV